METHVGNVVRTSYFHIRQLRLIRRSLTAEAAEALIRAFVHSRLDYCNGLLSGLTDRLYGRLQSVLRSAARLVLMLPRCSSVSEVMRRDLHWLAFPHRVTYKICVLVFKCQNNLAPEYLRRHCVPTSSVSGRSQLRSASTGMLLVPKTRTKRLAGRGFFFFGPGCLEQSPCWPKNWNKFRYIQEKLEISSFQVMTSIPELLYFFYCISLVDVLIISFWLARNWRLLNYNYVMCWCTARTYVMYVMNRCVRNVMK